MLDDSVDILYQNIVTCYYHLLLFLLLGLVISGAFFVGFSRRWGLFFLFLGVCLFHWLCFVDSYWDFRLIFLDFLFLLRWCNDFGVQEWRWYWLSLDFIFFFVWFGAGTYLLWLDLDFLFYSGWNTVAYRFLFFLLDGGQGNILWLKPLDVCCFRIASFWLDFNWLRLWRVNCHTDWFFLFFLNDRRLWSRCRVGVLYNFGLTLFDGEWFLRWIFIFFSWRWNWALTLIYLHWLLHCYFWQVI